MKLLKLLFPAIILVACSNSNANDIKPQFFPDYFTGLETQNITDYNKAKLDYDLTSSNNKNVHITDCIQVEKIKDSNILTSEYHLLTMLRINCKALKLYTQAGDSNNTYLQDLVINKDINNLPATTYPYVSDYDKTTRLGKTLKEYHKKLIVKQAIDGAINVETETDSLLYQVIATGDFNKDKISDALVRIDWHVIGAFGKGSKLVMITKKSVNSDFEEINLDQYLGSE